jgi:hypothetical protein
VGISNKASPQTILFTWGVPPCRGIGKHIVAVLSSAIIWRYQADAPGLGLVLHLVIAAWDATPAEFKTGTMHCPPDARRCIPVRNGDFGRC